MLELVLLLRGYYKLLRKEELFVQWLTLNPWEVRIVWLSVPVIAAIDRRKTCGLTRENPRPS